MKSRHYDMSVKHWEHRPEASWKKFQFNQPYARGLKRLKEDVLAKTNFDPATLWQWGTMQAMAVLEILKSAERQFGREGQQMVFESMKRVGYDIGRQITEGTSIPEDMTLEEWTSFYTTIGNRIVYASLEVPQIESEDRLNFHIDWCPHQDQYGTFDCRVQRYFVQGLIEAALDFVKSQGYEEEKVFDIMFKYSIPAGEETCFFVMQTRDTQSAQKWAEYTSQLEEKALEIAGKQGDGTGAR